MKSIFLLLLPAIVLCSCHTQKQEDESAHAVTLKGDIIHTLFGFGLGNCEQSSFSFLQSAFYNQYSYLHYRWFSHAWIFLEQGAIGLVLTGAFFLSIALSILKNRKKIKEVYDLAVFSFIPTCLIGLIYNCALELEVSYLIALICAFPFIARKNDK